MQGFIAEHEVYSSSFSLLQRLRNQNGAGTELRLATCKCLAPAHESNLFGGRCIVTVAPDAIDADFCA